MEPFPTAPRRIDSRSDRHCRVSPAPAQPLVGRAGARARATNARETRTRTRRPMPKRTDLKSILLLGSGPIVIGQAAEFDYCGTQAVRALREEGYRVILVNSNPATIMTDPDLADRHLHRADHPRVGGAGDREGEARRHPPHDGRADGAERGAGAARPRRARAARRGVDRRRRARHPHGGGPQRVRPGDGAHRVEGAARRLRSHAGRGAAAGGGDRATRPSSARASRWAAPAAASPTTARSSRSRCVAGWSSRP